MSCSAYSCSASQRNFSSRSCASLLGGKRAPRCTAFSLCRSTSGRPTRSSICNPCCNRPGICLPRPCLPPVPCGPCGSFPCGPLTSAAAPCGVLLTNEKQTMQDLNDRLSGYLDKVRYLEATNLELECKIKEFRANKCIAEREWDPCLSGIESLMYQIEEASVENSQLVLAIDNSRLTAEDFRTKWEIEVSLREDLEIDIQDLRNLANEYCECRNTVACEINVLEDEICHLKNSHREEIEALRHEYANSTLNVDIDHTPGVDLASIINDIRTQYETMISSTHYEVECLIQNKLDAAQASAHQSACNLEAIKTEANNLRYEFQALEVEAESLRSANCILEENLHETEARLNLEISNLAQIISVLEADYADVRSNIERQIREYESLLNVKMQLEMEIATYQQLIDCEDSRLANVSCGRVCYGDAVRCTALPVPCGANPCSLNVCPSEPKCGGPCGVCGPCLPCA